MKKLSIRILVSVCCFFFLYYIFYSIKKTQTPAVIIDSCRNYRDTITRQRDSIEKLILCIEMKESTIEEISGRIEFESIDFSKTK